MIRGFDPIAARDARVLVLGTIPSVQSLARSQYYAHPQNRFWPIMERLFGGEEPMVYSDRVALLRRSKVAVWDVLQAGERSGSLDSAIVSASEVPNDIAGFLREHPDIRTVFFNGAKAEALFRKHVAPTLPCETDLRLVRLPSTSAAHASMTFEAKVDEWQAVAEATR